MIYYILLNTIIGICIPCVTLVIIYKLSKSLKDPKDLIDSLIENNNNYEVSLWIFTFIFPISALMIFSILVYVHIIIGNHYDNISKYLNKSSINKLLSLGYNDNFTHVIHLDDGLIYIREHPLATNRDNMNDYTNSFNYFFTIHVNDCKKWLYDHYGIDINIKSKKGKYFYKCRYLGTNHLETGYSTSINGCYDKILSKI